MQNNNYQQPKKPTPLWMILVPVIVGALIVTGVAAYFVLNAKSKPVPVVVDEEDEDDDYTVRMSGYVGQYPVRMRLEVEGNRPEVGKALIDKMPVLKDALGENCENGVMYYLKDAKADFFKMMELVETVTF